MVLWSFQHITEWHMNTALKPNHLYSVNPGQWISHRAAGLTTWSVVQYIYIYISEYKDLCPFACSCDVRVGAGRLCRRRWLRAVGRGDAGPRPGVPRSLQGWLHIYPVVQVHSLLLWLWHDQEQEAVTHRYNLLQYWSDCDNASGVLVDWWWEQFPSLIGFWSGTDHCRPYTHSSTRTVPKTSLVESWF